MLGTSAIARITSVGRWSVFGEVIETLASTNVVTQVREETKPACTSDVSTCETCACSAESCCGEGKSGEACNVSGDITRQDHKTGEKSMTKEEEKQEVVSHWGLVDKALVCGVFVSSLTILVLIISIASRVLLRQCQ